MTTPNPNSASPGPQQPDLGRVAQRAAQAAASSLGDMALQYAMTAELGEMQTNRVTELEQQVRDHQVDKARMAQTIRGLEERVAELTADADGAGDEGETGDAPEGSAHGEG